LTESPEDLHINPEDMELEPEYIQEDEALWTKASQLLNDEGEWSADAELTTGGYYVYADELFTDFYVQRLSDVALWYVYSEPKITLFYRETFADEGNPDFFVVSWEDSYEWYVESEEAVTDFYIETPEMATDFYLESEETD
jgi:hypothetical protein